MATEPPEEPGAAEVEAARARIARYVRRTPTFRLSLRGRPLVLKLEHLQSSGSFKLRGALNAMLSAPRSPVVTASGGNHGLGVATAAALLGVRATIVVPTSTPESKARRIAATGAELVRRGESYAAAAEEAARRVGQGEGRDVPAYDHPDVVAGQGTVASEVVEDVPEVDALVVAVGGGGLAAGCSLAAGGRTVVAVEPERCCCLHDALLAGQPIDSPVDSIASSALGATRVGTLPFRLLRKASLSSVLVTDDELLAARDLLWEEARLAVEPAAAAGLAALLAGRVDARLPCLVLCGANTDWTPS